jgi:hypothetical protein
MGTQRSWLTLTRPPNCSLLSCPQDFWPRWTSAVQHAGWKTWHCPGQVHFPSCLLTGRAQGRGTGSWGPSRVAGEWAVPLEVRGKGHTLAPGFCAHSDGVVPLTLSLEPRGACCEWHPNPRVRRGVGLGPITFPVAQ